VLAKSIKQLNRVSVSVSLELGLVLGLGLGSVLGVVLGLVFGFVPTRDIVLKNTVLSSSFVPKGKRQKWKLTIAVYVQVKV